MNKQYIIRAPRDKVIDGETKRFYATVGRAWLNPAKEGKTEYINIQLDSLPLGGELLGFPVEEEE